MTRYLISEDELLQLLEDSFCLQALETAGVDNWQGCGEADEEVKDSLLEEMTSEETIQQLIKKYDGNNTVCVPFREIAKLYLSGYEKHL